jgi:nitrile hydratase accessory protein
VARDDVAEAARVLGGGAPFPMADGEPVFAEPWEGRAFAMAVELVARSGLPWEAFRSRLVAAIGDDPHRPYYESWVVALERLVLDTGAVDGGALARERRTAASYRYHEQGVGDVEVVPLRPDELPGVLAALGDPMSAPDVVDPAACRHAERYRVVSRDAPGGWRFRAFDAAGELLLDVPAPDPRFS